MDFTSIDPTNKQSGLDQLVYSPNSPSSLSSCPSPSPPPPPHPTPPPSKVRLGWDDAGVIQLLVGHVPEALCTTIRFEPPPSPQKWRSESRVRFRRPPNSESPSCWCRRVLALAVASTSGLREAATYRRRFGSPAHHNPIPPSRKFWRSDDDVA